MTATNPFAPPAGEAEPENAPPLRIKRARCPTVLQMEAVECGAAALGIVLGYYGRIVTLEELRVECGVSRDGSKASNVLKAARKYGLEAKGFRLEPSSLAKHRAPMILFWNFNHFVVLEGVRGNKVFINDPAQGPVTMTLTELDECFTGVVLTFAPGPDFKRGGQSPSLLAALGRRLRGVKLPIAYLIIAGLFLVVPGLMIPAFSQIFVDEFLVSRLDHWIKPLLIAMALTALVRGGLTFLQQHYLMRLDARLALSMAGRFFWHIVRLPVHYYTQRYAGDIASRAEIEVRIRKLLSGELATTVIDCLMVVFYAAMMWYFDPVLTVIGLVAAGINILFLKIVSRARVDTTRRMTQEAGKLAGASISGLASIESLKAAGRESDFFVNWAGLQAGYANSQQKIGLLGAMLNGLPHLLNSLTNLAVLCIGGFRVMEGHLSMGMLVAFQGLMASFLGPIGNLVSLGGRLQELQGDMARLDDVLGHDVDEEVRREVVESPFAASDRLRGHLELRNVTFGYSPLEPPLIRDLNLILKPGARVALVGKSGCGKSTITKLVSGLYKPWSGEILMDGIPRERIPRRVLNNSIATVDQEIFVFEGTARENLTLWDETVPDERMVAAAQDACIHDEIASRPGGYLSKIEESGRNYSGGQRQRIEIARSLVNDPRLLIMDEATSALDTETEQIIDRNLRRRGCSAIIVAHRLSTIRDADEILVMENGIVVQRGTHEELVKTPGLYAELVRS